MERGTRDQQSASQATRDLVDLVEAPAGMFAVNHIAVISVADPARARPVEMPPDIVVVCLDEIDHAPRFRALLTAMLQFAETCETIATQLLLGRLAGRVRNRRRGVVLPADLTVGECCGAQLPVS